MTPLRIHERSSSSSHISSHFPDDRGLNREIGLLDRFGALRRNFNLLRSLRFHSVPELVEWIVIKTHFSRGFGANA
jgi:hypothetical protein